MELKKLKTKVGSLMMGAGIIDDILGMFLFIFICFLFTGTFAIKEIVIIFGAIISFFVGILVHKFVGREKRIIYYFEKFLFFFVTPFFFISLGVHFSLQSMTLNPLLLIAIIVIVIVGKIFGVLLTKPFTKLRVKQLYLIGWGMNSRGAVELAIAFLAFKVGLLDINIYSSLVVMALVTTLIFPFFVRRMIKKDSGIIG